MEKRQFNEIPKEAPENKTKESEKLKEKAMSSSKKIKFRRGAIGTIPISLNCSTSSLILPVFFKSKGDGEKSY